MRVGRWWLAAVTATALAPAARLAAHHSVLPFDNEHGTTIAGVVAHVRWQNPHAIVALDVDSGDGAVVRWTVEAESPRVLERLGWSTGSLRAGDRIVVLGAAAKDGSRALRCKELALANGRVLPCFPP